MAPLVSAMLAEVVLKAPMSSVPPATVTVPGSALVAPTARVPLLTVVPPVKELAPVSVTVPVVDLVIAPAPPRMAPTLPDCTLYDEPESTPLVPVMDPLERMTLPTD